MSKYEYKLVRRANMRSIRLKVTESGLIVSAPCVVSVEEIENMLEKNSGFIENAMRRMNSRPALAEDEVMILGQRVKVAVRSFGGTRLEKGVLHLMCPEKDRDKYLEAYLEKLARAELTASLDRVMPLFEGMGLERPRLTVRRMTTRWGSCTPQRKSIRLNMYLVKAPRELIDSVTIHELCHFFHPDHGKGFYSLYGRLCPNHRQYKKRLDALGIVPR